MDFLRKAKEGWENISLPRIQEGKTKVELERDKRYETNWVWLHTVMAIEILHCNILLVWIALKSLSFSWGVLIYVSIRILYISECTFSIAI